MFSGSIPALVTPFRGGAFDEVAFRRLVDWQIENGSSGLVPVGTTGESPTLSHDEHRRVVEIVIAQAKGRVPVIAGAGSNNTTEAIDLAIVYDIYDEPDAELLLLLDAEGPLTARGIEQSSSSTRDEVAAFLQHHLARRTIRSVVREGHTFYLSRPFLLE